MLHLIGLPVRGSCRNFCDNWKSAQFLLQGIGNVLADGLDVTPEERGELLTIDLRAII